MSTYTPINNFLKSEDKKISKDKEKIIKSLNKWLNSQQWVKNNLLTWEISSSKVKNEFKFLFLCENNVDLILEKFRNMDYENQKIEISSIEKAFWNNSTYFIDFKIL